MYVYISTVLTIISVISSFLISRIVNFFLKFARYPQCFVNVLAKGRNSFNVTSNNKGEAGRW